MHRIYSQISCNNSIPAEAENFVTFLNTHPQLWFDHMLTKSYAWISLGLEKYVPE